MLKERDYLFNKLNKLFDIILITLAFLIAHLIRNYILAQYILPQMVSFVPLKDYIWLVIPGIIIAIIFLNANGIYSSMRVLNNYQVVKKVFISCLEITVSLTFLFFFFKINKSRVQIYLFCSLTFLFLLIKNISVKTFLVNLRKKGHNYQTVVFIGSGDRLKEFIDIFDKHPFWGFKIQGIISDDSAIKKGDKLFGYDVIGSYKDSSDILFENPADEIVIIPNKLKLDELAGVLESCEEMGLKARFALNFFKHEISHPKLVDYEDVSVLTYFPTRDMNFALFIKYLFDKIAAAILLIIFSIPMLIIAIAIKLTSKPGEKIIFKQRRVGLYGRTYWCYKFRTMVSNAEELKKHLLKFNELDGPAFKIQNDPRITRLGRILRITSLDELPQLYNVLVGNMSLVGPRPPVPEEAAKYDKWHRRRFSMKPGLTCLWQISGRNKLAFDRWVKLDLEYIDNWSLLLDFKILVKTVFVVITGYGAM